MQPGVSLLTPRVTVWIRFGARDPCSLVLRVPSHRPVPSQPFDFESKFADPDVDKTHAVTMDSPLARRMLSNRAGSENQERKEVIKMKKTISLLSNLLLSVTLFWGVSCSGSERARRDGSR